MKHYIYQYLDPLTLTPFYIGKGSGNRHNTHINKARKNIKKSYPVIDKCKQLLKEGLVPIIEILEYFEEESSAFIRETELIQSIGRKDLGTGSLLNLTDGGEGGLARKWSDQRKESWKGEKNPMFGKVAWKEANQSNPMKGKKHSLESKEKMSKKFKESYTAEHKLQRSIRVKGSKNPAYGKPAINRRSVHFRGINFECIAHACIHFNVSRGTVYKEGKFN